MSISSPPLTRSDINRQNARARWGAQRIVRLDQLDADTARLIRALLANAQAEPAKAEKAASDG